MKLISLVFFYIYMFIAVLPSVGNCQVAKDGDCDPDVGNCRILANPNPPPNPNPNPGPTQCSGQGDASCYCPKETYREIEETGSRCKCPSGASCNLVITYTGPVKQFITSFPFFISSAYAAKDIPTAGGCPDGEIGVVTQLYKYSCRSCSNGCYGGTGNHYSSTCDEIPNGMIMKNSACVVELKGDCTPNGSVKKFTYINNVCTFDGCIQGYDTTSSGGCVMNDGDSKFSVGPSSERDKAQKLRLKGGADGINQKKDKEKSSFTTNSAAQQEKLNFMKSGKEMPLKTFKDSLKQIPNYVPPTAN